MNVAVDLLLSQPAPELEQTELKKVGKTLPLLQRAMVHEQIGRSDLAAKDRALATQLIPELQITDNRK